MNNLYYNYSEIKVIFFQNLSEILYKFGLKTYFYFLFLPTHIIKLLDSKYVIPWLGEIMNLLLCDIKITGRKAGNTKKK